MSDVPRGQPRSPGEEMLRRIRERDKGICQICGQRIERGNGSLDHIVPKVRGGGFTFENLQLAHVRCNQTKGASR